jgi:hypothetical protein
MIGGSSLLRGLFQLGGHAEIDEPAFRFTTMT